MPKQIEKLKKQLLELAEAVNSFNHESVQTRVISRLLAHLEQYNKQNHEPEVMAPDEEPVSGIS